MEMPFTKELLETGWKWLNANASDKVGLCSDRSCIRCRLADVLFELEQRSNEHPTTDSTGQPPVAG